MNFFAKALAIWAISLQLYSADLWPNLENMAQDFVLETKQIHIPGYEDAFNPSIIRWNGKLLLCFRTRDPITNSTNPIGFVYLNEQFEPVSEPQIIDMASTYTQSPSRAQDPRLITVGEELLMVYSNLVETCFGEIRRVFVSKLNLSGDTIFIESTFPITMYEGLNPIRQEKNWTPFDYEGQLLLAYSYCPHRVFLPHETGYCETVGTTTGDIKWDWGELRGGTQAFLQEDGQYLSFFHSSKEMKTCHSSGKKISHYFIGAYTFSSEPPFEITRISPQPIIAKGFYSPEREYPTWKPLRVVFPGGFIADEEHIWIVYGRQDFELWVMKLDKKRLLDNLVPVKTQE